MINKKGILGRLESILKPKNVALQKRIINPTREWLIGLLVFFLIVTIGASQSAYMFVTYRNINTEEVTPIEEIVRYNELLVGNVLHIYGERSAAYNALLSRTTQQAVPVSENESTSTSTAETTISDEKDETVNEEDAVLMFE